jgi:hypothetical protein
VLLDKERIHLGIFTVYENVEGETQMGRNLENI